MAASALSGAAQDIALVQAAHATTATFSMALKKAGVPEEFVEHPVAQTLLNLASPAVVHALAGVFANLLDSKFGEGTASKIQTVAARGEKAVMTAEGNQLLATIIPIALEALSDLKEVWTSIPTDNLTELLDRSRTELGPTVEASSPSELKQPIVDVPIVVSEKKKTAARR